MNIQRGGIWLINFDPSFGHEYQKVRPGLIIGNSRYLDSGTLITVLPLSSAIDKKMELDVPLPATRSNRLMKDSLVKVQQISTFDKRRIVKYIGVCEDAAFQNVCSSLRLYLALA